MSITNLRTARTVTLLEVVVCEDDPLRLVTYYFTPDGRPVMTDDKRGIEEPNGIGKDGLSPEERHPRPKVTWVPQPDGTMRRTDSPVPLAYRQDGETFMEFADGSKWQRVRRPERQSTGDKSA